MTPIANTGSAPPPEGSDETACRIRGDAKPVSTRKSLLFVYGGYLFRYLYLLILIPFYGRVLGAEAYGSVLAAMSLFNVVWLVVEYGFPIVGSRDVASARSDGAIGREFGRQIKARLMTTLVGATVGVIGTFASSVLRADPAFGLIATALGIVSAFNLGWYFAGTHRFRTSILFEVAGFALSLVLILSLVRGPHDGILVLGSLLISSLVVTAGAYALAIPQIGRNRIRFNGALSLFRSATTLFAASRAPTIVTNGSSYLLSLFATAQSVGFFGAAERLATVALSLFQPAGQVLVPTVTRRLSAPGDKSDAYRLMRAGTLYTLCLGMACMVGALVISPYLIPIILGPGFEPSVRIMQVFSLMFPFAALNRAICGYVLVPLRQDKLIVKATLSGVGSSLLLMSVLAGTYGGIGVAAARVTGEIVTSAVLMAAAWQQRGFGLLVRQEACCPPTIS